MKKSLDSVLLIGLVFAIVSLMPIVLYSLVVNLLQIDELAGLRFGATVNVLFVGFYVLLKEGRGLSVFEMTVGLLIINGFFVYLFLFQGYLHLFTVFYITCMAIALWGIILINRWTV
jgi:hypothetical protein